MIVLFNVEEARSGNEIFMYSTCVGTIGTADDEMMMTTCMYHSCISIVSFPASYSMYCIIHVPFHSLVMQIHPALWNRGSGNETIIPTRTLSFWG